MQKVIDSDLLQTQDNSGSQTELRGRAARLGVFERSGEGRRQHGGPEGGGGARSEHAESLGQALLEVAPERGLRGKGRAASGVDETELPERGAPRQNGRRANETREPPVCERPPVIPDQKRDHARVGGSGDPRK